jgi:acetylornithine/LysW-gamma-L-lysine aminotransferase
MNSAEIIELENAHTSGVYAKQPIVFVRGQGALLWDADGNQYIDCAAGHGVANLGHAHPKIAAALAAQSARLITLFETFPNDQRALLMKELTSLASGLDRVFFCNSGTESIEAAIKFARLSTGRPGIIATMRGFHGRTLGALSATWNKAYRTPFEPLVPGFSHVAYNNVEALAATVNETTAAVILEPVQGEGGVYPADPGYLEAALEICRTHGSLLIIDEVQTGFCRTGKMFAYQHSSITPDLLCCSKSIAGGIPMGAVLIGERVANLTPGTHGSTFGGNPLACAAALAALSVMQEENLAQQAEVKGAYLMDKIQAIHSSQIREVRGKGLMIGIELKQKAAPYLKALQAKHILALNAGMTVIRLLPPLVISYTELDQAAIALQEVLGDE